MDPGVKILHMCVYDSVEKGVLSPWINHLQAHGKEKS